MEMQQHPMPSPIGAVLSANPGLHFSPFRPRFAKCGCHPRHHLSAPVPSQPPRAAALWPQSEQTGTRERTAVARRRPPAPRFVSECVKDLNAPGPISPPSPEKTPLSALFRAPTLVAIFWKIGVAAAALGGAAFLPPTPPHGPPRGKNVLGGAAGKPPLLSRPGGERRDESRLYASKFPCGTMFAAVRSHTTRQAPLSGANYSITAGKRSAPAESRRIYMWAPRGSNTREVAPRTPHTRSAQCVLPRGRSTPLGPKWRGEPCPRARCAYPRL